MARHFGVTQRWIPMGFLGGSALTGDGEIPEGHADSIDATYVPGRNVAFLSAASAVAAAEGADSVLIGANADDEAGYPDCRREFFNTFNSMLEEGIAEPVRVVAPFLYDTKRQIVQYGRSINAPIHLSWSCYRGLAAGPCGRCGACISRNEAMQ